jgi:hypothetical protein
VRRALEFKLEVLQDMADAEIMLAHIKSGKEKTFTLDEVRKELGLKVTVPNGEKMQLGKVCHRHEVYR